MGLPDDDYEALREIYRLRGEGALFAQLQDGREYVLLLHELYPNGTTSETFVDDPLVTQEVGEVTGLGPATDAQGWGIWEVNKIAQRRQQP